MGRMKVAWIATCMEMLSGPIWIKTKTAYILLARNLILNKE